MWAGDALAGRNGTRELMLYRVPRFILRNGGIDLRTVSLISERCVRTGMHGRPVVSIDSRGRRCSRCFGSRPDGRWCPASKGWDRAGASLCRPRNTGQLRSSVPNPRSLNFTSGLPESSSGFGLPISARSPPPRSNTRSTLPGCEVSQRASGSRCGRMPLLCN